MDKDLELAMNNAYDIIIDYATIDQLIDKQPNQPIYLAFDPEKMEQDDYWDDTIDSMIEYFILTVIILIYTMVLLAIWEVLHTVKHLLLHQDFKKMLL